MAFIHYKILHVNTIDSNNLLSIELSSFLLFKKERKEFMPPHLNIKKKRKKKLETWRLAKVKVQHDAMFVRLNQLGDLKKVSYYFFSIDSSAHPNKSYHVHSLAWTITFHSKEISQYSLIRHDINNHENTHAHI